MEYASRTTNSIRNIVLGTGNQLLLILLNFISQIIFIQYLGIEYLGLNSLLFNLITIFSLADLGLGSAMTYSLYQPLADNNQKKVISLICFYKTVYRWIAIIIFGIGVLMAPFLSFIINTNFNFANLYLYYFLFVINSVCSYLYMHKTTLLIADQKMYILKIYNSYFAIIKFILQFLVLILFKSFLGYLCIQFISTLLYNLICAKKTDKLYPYINEKKNISACEKKEIFNNVKSMFFYRLSGVMVNNTGNILISIILGTVWVGYYANYSMIISGMSGFIILIFSSLQASVGNLAVTTNLIKQFEIFKLLNFCTYWLVGVACICFFSISEDFIQLWIGKAFILPKEIVFPILLNFFMPMVLYPVWNFRDSTNIFQKTKYIALLTAIINLVLSLVLGYRYGLSGILYATVIARLVTNFWYEPYLLFKLHFKVSPSVYFYDVIKYSVFIFIIGFFTIELTNNFLYENVIYNIITKMIICLIVPNIILTVIIYPLDEFKMIKTMFLKFKYLILNRT